MRRILVVAAAELGASVRTKAFIVSIVLMPILILGSILVQRLVDKHTDTTTRAFAVLDHTGVLYADLAERTEARNRLVAGGPGKAAVAARFVPSPVALDGRAVDDVRFELSERIRRKELFAYVEIPADALSAGAAAIQYHSDNPTYEDLRMWVDLSLNEAIRVRRFRDAGIDGELVARLEARVPSEHLGLWTRGADGALRQAAKVDKIRTYVVPAVLMFLLFMVVMTGAPQLLNSVLEEKMSRISEVLLGSVTPFQLMMGKLVGSAGVSLILASIYLAGGAVAAGYLGYLDLIPLGLAPWFFLYLVMAVFFYGSLYIAVGSACTELKDAQSLMMPVMLLTVFPMFVWTAILKSPHSTFAVAVSMFPPATPFLMMLRQTLHPAPPLWQVGGSVVLTAAATIGCVWAAGKIFRVGVLVQGKSASFGQMLRWVLAR